MGLTVRIFICNLGNTLVSGGHFSHVRKTWLSVPWDCLQTPAFFFFFLQSLDQAQVAQQTFTLMFFLSALRLEA